ncbi:MAG: hypothetical protein U0791_17565 [Gemmataceae bacterium]
MKFVWVASLRFALASIVFAALLLASETGRAPAQPKAGDLPPLNQAAIDESIARGVEYLKATQNADGSWGDGPNVIGITALTGIALIESGTRTSDASIAKAATYLRTKAPTLSRTYPLALTIIFLDRMKNPKVDDPTIQSLACRLMGGQTMTGGWGYEVQGGPRGARVSDAEVPQMINALKKLTPPPPVVAVSYRERPSRIGLCIKQSEEIIVKPSAASLSAEAFEKKRASVLKEISTSLRNKVVFQDPDQWQELPPLEKKEKLEAEKGDNSNTHFAIIGLWTARKHGVPTERTFALVAKRFRTSQDPSGGGWAYGYPQGGSNHPMTCIGLLGLACGNALGVDPSAARPEQDPAILKSLKFLGGNVGMPVGHFKDRPKIKDVGGLYYLWALERIAVLYDVATLDKKDWYRWGAEILISNQERDGSWTQGGFPEGEKANVCTPLAILVLQRANLTPDLSKKLIIDSSALTAKVNEPTTPPPPPPPMPTPKSEPPPPKFELPKIDFTPKKSEPEPTKTTPPPTVESAPAKKEEDAPMWPWLAGGIGLVVAICLGLVFVMRKKKSEDDEDEEDEEEEEDEKPKKKTKAKSGGDTKPKSKKSKK